MPKAETNDIMLTWLSIIFDREEDRKYKLDKALAIGLLIFALTAAGALMAVVTGNVLHAILDPNTPPTKEAGLIVFAWPISAFVLMLMLTLAHDTLREIDFKYSFIRENGRKPLSSEYPKADIKEYALMFWFAVVTGIVGYLGADVIASMSVASRLTCAMMYGLCTLIWTYMLYKRKQTRARAIVESQIGVE